MTVLIRPAELTDANATSSVAWAAKAHWGYAPELLETWATQLRFTDAYLSAHTVLVAERDGVVVGVGALEDHGTHREIGHLWVLPAAQGRGIGRALLRRLLDKCGTRPGTVRVESDPNAAGFYARAGGKCVGAIAAPILADLHRVLPVFEFVILPPP